MPIRCPKCATRHDVARFEENKKIQCRCGNVLDLSLIATVEDFERYFKSEAERVKARNIQDDAQVICQMILNDDCLEVDIEIAKNKLRDKVKELFPDKLETYKMIYEARFNRLWEQFRQWPGKK